MKKFLNNIVDIGLLVLITFLVFLLLIVLYKKIIIKDDTLLLGDFSVFKITSGSMEDTLSIDDFILVRKNGNYNVGDIITYKQNNYYVTHRIKQIDEKMIITQGDANNVEDKPIKIDSVVGKMIIKIPIINFVYKYRHLFITVLIIFTVLNNSLQVKKINKRMC